MKQTEVNFNAKDILQKHFKVVYKGYDPIEVDTFLDLIMKDYHKFYQIINDLYSKVKKITNDQSGLYVNLQRKIYNQKQINNQVNQRNKRLLNKLQSQKEIEEIALGERRPTQHDWNKISKRISYLEHSVYNE